MNVRNRRILCARISRHHHVAFLFRLHQLLSDVALHNFMSEVPSQRVATQRFNLKALLQRQSASLQPNIHQPSAGEVGVSEYRDHLNSQRAL
jgi:hypothetical protein